MTVCRHFGVCGGCVWQDMPPSAYRAAKKKLVTDALARAGLGAVPVEEPAAVPPFSRRRAVFKLARRGGALEIGFHARASHAIVDMRECRVLTPALFALTEMLRAALPPLLEEGEAVELHVTQADNGLDLAFRGARRPTSAWTADLAKALSGGGIVRTLFNKTLVLELEAPVLALAGVPVTLPPMAFLQASADGEAALQARVLALAGDARRVVDLFAGLGTFALPLARKASVHAVEQDAHALAALDAAARATHRFAGGGLKPLTTEVRDLFKLPLTPPELNRFDAVVLDPPRAGAAAQVRALAASRVARIVYVSCDAESFARDARVMADAGFAVGTVAPIDQFLYAGHIELVAGFTRPAAPRARRGRR